MLLWAQQGECSLLANCSWSTCGRSLQQCFHRQLAAVPECVCWRLWGPCGGAQVLSHQPSWSFKPSIGAGGCTCNCKCNPTLSLRLSEHLRSWRCLCGQGTCACLNCVAGSWRTLTRQPDHSHPTVPQLLPMQAAAAADQHQPASKKLCSPGSRLEQGTSGCGWFLS